MKLLKNKEIVRILAIIAALGAAGVIACLFIDWRAALVCLALTVGVIMVYYSDARMRYRRMERLSAGIDAILSGDESLDLNRYDEGELSILENEIQKLTVKLREQASELEKDKQLLADSIADISHQIRTPLTAMNLLLAALGDPDAPEDKRREHLSDMHRQLSRIDWLVSALLKLARLDANAVAMNMRSVELAQLVADSLAPIAIQMELKDQTAVVAASGSVFCDPSWTAEALTNILKNCSEHMGEGRLHITASENPIYSQITIRDEGPGIDGKDLPHLFERFYKGGNSDKNSVGIGLALCRMIVVKQNGTVKAENAPQGGALFTVRIYKETV